MRNEMKRYKETTIHRFKCTLKGHKFTSNICNVPANPTVYLTVMDVPLCEASNGKIILISGLHSRRVCLPLINQAFSVNSGPADSRKSVFLTPSAWAKALEWVPHFWSHTAL